jgi:hypothetical protein
MPIDLIFNIHDIQRNTHVGLLFMSSIYILQVAQTLKLKETQRFCLLFTMTSSSTTVKALPKIDTLSIVRLSHQVSFILCLKNHSISLLLLTIFLLIIIGSC